MEQFGKYHLLTAVTGCTVRPSALGALAPAISLRVRRNAFGKRRGALPAKVAAVR